MRIQTSESDAHVFDFHIVLERVYRVADVPHVLIQYLPRLGNWDTFRQTSTNTQKIVNRLERFIEFYIDLDGILHRTGTKSAESL